MENRVELISSFEDKYFLILEDLPEVGCYLYVYQNGQCIKDFLQDNIEQCKHIAFEDYGINYDSWHLRQFDRHNCYSNENKI